MVKKAVKHVLIAVLWLTIWEVASLCIGKELLLPSPIRVLTRLGVLVLEASFWSAVFRSLLSVLCGVGVALVLGVLLGFLTARYRVLHDILSPLLSVIKATPVASFIILALVWITRSGLPAFISGLMVMPILWSNIEEGILHIDKELLEMAQVFRLPRTKIIGKIVIPSVLPYFAAALRTSLGLAWKAGIAAEVLATPKGTIGQSLFDAKVLLETTDLFAWTLTVILLSIVLEKAVFLLLGCILSKTHTGGDVKCM